MLDRHVTCHRRNVCRVVLPGEIRCGIHPQLAFSFPVLLILSFKTRPLSSHLLAPGKSVCTVNIGTQRGVCDLTAPQHLF